MPPYWRPFQRNALFTLTGILPNTPKSLEAFIESSVTFKNNEEIEKERKRASCWLWRSMVAQLPKEKNNYGIADASNILKDLIEIKDNDFLVGDLGVSTAKIVQEPIPFRELDMKLILKIQQLSLGRLMALDENIKEDDYEKQLENGVKCIWYTDK